MLGDRYVGWSASQFPRLGREKRTRPELLVQGGSTLAARLRSGRHPGRIALGDYQLTVSFTPIVRGGWYW